MSESVWFKISYVKEYADGLGGADKVILSQNAKEVYSEAHRIADESGYPCLVQARALNIERTIFPAGMNDLVHPTN